MQTNTTPVTAQRGQGDLARARAIVRFNSVMFHSLAAASLLESAVPLYAERLNVVLAGQPEARLWLEQVWVAQRAELGRRLREYTEATWPELDWNSAYAEFQQPCRARAASGRPRAGVVAPTDEERRSWDELEPGIAVLEEEGARPADERAADEFYLRTLAAPAVDVHGVSGGEAALQKTVLPVAAEANVSIRLAPGQDVEEIDRAFQRLLRNAAPRGAELEIERWSAAPAGLIPPDAPAVRLAQDAFERAGDPAVERQQRVQVAVPGVEHVRDDQVVALGDLVDAGEDLHQPGPGNDAVVEVIVGSDLRDG